MPSPASAHHLSVLIASYPFADGYRLLALGEELVQRGHNVSFCSTVNWESLDQIAQERGMDFMNVGKFSVSKNEFYRMHKEMIAGLNSLYVNPIAVATRVQRHVKLSIEQVVEYLQRLDLRRWDLIVVPEAFANSATCLAQQVNVPVIVVMKRLVIGYHQPEWPFSDPVSTGTDDLSFAERLQGVIQQPLQTFLMQYIHPGKLSLTDPICKRVFHTALPECHEFPCLVVSPFGFEFARTVSPLVEYVGPILLKENTTLPSDLSMWLAGKSERSVVYINMGHYVEPTIALAQTIVEGLQPTGYSVVWNLWDITQSKVGGLELDTSRFFIADSIPESKLLQHQSVAMAVLHGENIALIEAIYHAVPLIVIPFGGDHGGNAARVEASGAGITLDMSKLSAATIRASVETIASREYLREAQRLRKISLQAGGVERAADLVELYADVGYQHLVPAYIKYKWSWVQYYNADVWLVLGVLGASVICCTVKLFKCCCRMIGSRKVKSD